MFNSDYQPPETSHLPQHVAVDILSLTPALRTGLKFTVQAFAGQPCYVIEDPLRGSFYRVGLPEYTLLSMLDGRTTIASALAGAATMLGDQAPSEQEAAALCKWLVVTGLAATRQSAGGERLIEAAAADGRQQAMGWLNPMYQKAPLLNPQPWLERLPRAMHLLFSPGAVCAWMAVILYALYLLMLERGQFFSAGAAVLSADNWAWLIVSTVALKLIHEFAHALACHRYGGAVRESGVMLVLMAPLPYVDVTSAWSFSSKWQRIAVSAAGMYAELFIAALAMIVWSHTDNPVVQQHARNLILSATVITILFNANPLMRFDGYYMLTDWLELPNLASHGQQWLNWRLWRGLPGAPAEPEWPEGRKPVIALYAIAALAWRCIVCIGLVIGASHLFAGAGVVIAMAAVAMWAGAPLYRFVTSRPGFRLAMLRRTLTAVAAAGAAAYVLWMWTPYYTRVTAPAIVDYAEVTETRSTVAGFLKHIYGQPGDRVEAGQLLAVLENEELTLQVRSQQLALRKSVLKSRKLRGEHNISAAIAEDDFRQSLQSRLKQLEQQQSQLEIYAPHAGRLLTALRPESTGVYIQPGDLIVTTGKVSDVKIVALAAQSEVDSIRGQCGAQVRFHTWGDRARFRPATLSLVQPRATTQISHLALAAPGGGPLDVRETTTAGEPPSWELLIPHIEIEARLTQAGHRIYPGQTGYLEFRTVRGTVGQAIYRGFAQWISDQKKQAAAAIDGA